MCELQTNNRDTVFDDIDLGLKSILDDPYHQFYSEYNVNVTLKKKIVFRRKKKFYLFINIIRADLI